MLLTFGALCLLLACNTKKNTNNTNCDNTITTRVENLKQAFEQRNYPCFFRQFPNTYKELIEFYGYDDSTGAKPLYDYYYSHINYLFEYDGKLIDEAFVIKVYGIAKNGIWDADCVGLFQLNLIELIERNPVVILQVLSKQPAKDITGFWFFVFDGAEIFDLQNKERFDMIYNKIDSLDKKQGLILKNEFKKMYSPPKVQYSYDRSFPGYLEGKGLDGIDVHSVGGIMNEGTPVYPVIYKHSMDLIEFKEQQETIIKNNK